MLILIVEAKYNASSRAYGFLIHVARMGKWEMRASRKPEKKSSLGRRRDRWKDNIKTDIANNHSIVKSFHKYKYSRVYPKVRIELMK
jgi:hypothetical protein